MHLSKKAKYLSYYTALQSTHKRVRVGAVATTRKGKIISLAYNDSYKTHPLQDYFYKKTGEVYRNGIHAEILALIRAKNKGAYIYVTRILKNNTIVESKPCLSCLKGLEKTTITKIIYSLNTSFYNIIQL